MRRLLVSIVSLHWAVVFAVLAVRAAEPAVSFGLAGRAVQGFWALDPIAASISVGFALASTLFLWTFLHSLTLPPAGMGEADPVFRKAFGAGALMITAAAAAELVRPDLVGNAIILVQLLALVGSYFVVRLDRRAETTRTAANDNSRAAARLLAIRASNGMMLGRRADRLTGLQGDR